MSQQKEPDNHKNNSSNIRNRNSTLTSKKNLGESDAEVDLETEVEDGKESFTERWRTSRFWLVKGSYHVLRSIWLTVMVIGGFIVWLISFLFI